MLVRLATPAPITVPLQIVNFDPNEPPIGADVSFHDTYRDAISYEHHHFVSHVSPQSQVVVIGYGDTVFDGKPSPVLLEGQRQPLGFARLESI
jgi:hypothetical protein